MNQPLPRISLAGLPALPPSGSLQFFDGYFPALPAGTYNINVAQTLSGGSSPPSFSLPQQSFAVQAPEFFIDTTIVQTIYPPAGGSDKYGQRLPFLVLDDPSLPWERSLVPDSAPSGPANPTPWMALLIFAEGEILLPPNSNNPVSSRTVSELLTADPDKNVLKPTLPANWVSDALLASTCQTITIPGAVFNAVMPSTADLSYLAHCRGVNTPSEGEQLLSVLLCNRLAVANGTVHPAAPLRYYAHLVSLEGYGGYLAPNGSPIPQKPSGGLMDVQLVSLFNWTFVSLPETGQSFEALVEGLIQSEQATAGSLSLPLSGGTNLPPSIEGRLADGYAPLTFVAGSGDQSFAWYRGPFSATVPQPLPAVGDPAVPAAQAKSADALMIYLVEQGLFDLSYAAAWNLGRQLALSDAAFAQNLNVCRQAARRSLTTLAQRMAMPHLAGTASPQALLAGDPSRRHFAKSIAAGLGRQWTAALAGVRQTPAPANVRRMPRLRARAMLHPEHVLAHPGVAAAITENLSEITAQAAKWLTNLSLLRLVPFSALVPDPRLLPVESARFFYVDPNWTEALAAGTLSIAIHSSSDIALYKLLLPSFLSGTGGERSGMLLRSQLVSGWPKLVVTASIGGAPLPILRNECLAPNVRLVLFDGIPDTVTLAEPYQGLQFGVENDGIHPRCVTSYVLAGALFAKTTPVAPALRTPADGSVGGVLAVATQASLLQSAAGVVPFAQNAVVQWNGTPLATTFVSGTQLTAVVPANLTAAPATAAVTVASAGAVSQAVNFVIDAPLEIDSINPALVLAGADAFVLSVSGIGFAAGTTVQWNGAALPTTLISASQVTAAVPANLVANLGAAAITVLVAGVTSNSVTLRIVGGDAVIDALEPNVAVAGGPGFALTVMGSGFVANAVAQWNGVALTTSFVNDQQLTAAVPAALISSTGSAAVTVMVNGTASDPVAFAIAGSSPVIGALQPSVAIAGGEAFTLVVNGVNFAKDAQIQWNGTALTTTFADPKELTASVPAGLLASAGTATVTVNSKGVVSNAAHFTVLGPQPAIGLLEPASVVAGGGQLTLTVTGGFGAGDFALQMVAAPELQSFITH
jgi:hypothetical protein